MLPLQFTLIKQGEPGLSLEILMSWALLPTEHTQRTVLKVASVQPAQQVCCHVRSTPAASNSESTPQNGTAMTWISQAQLA